MEYPLHQKPQADQPPKEPVNPGISKNSAIGEKPPQKERQAPNHEVPA